MVNSLKKSRNNLALDTYYSMTLACGPCGCNLCFGHDVSYVMFTVTEGQYRLYTGG